MGRKYLGKHKGETRGPYERALLYTETKNEKETIKLDNKINDYFWSIGYHLSFPSGYEENDFNNQRTYHVAGATIALSARSKFKVLHPYLFDSKELKIEKIRLKEMKPYIQLLMASNQGLDDIILKIKDNFPVFKERPLNNRRY